MQQILQRVLCPGFIEKKTKINMPVSKIGDVSHIMHLRNSKLYTDKIKYFQKTHQILDNRANIVIEKATHTKGYPPSPNLRDRKSTMVGEHDTNREGVERFLVNNFCTFINTFWNVRKCTQKKQLFKHKSNIIINKISFPLHLLKLL